MPQDTKRTLVPNYSAPKDLSPVRQEEAPEPLESYHSKNKRTLSPERDPFTMGYREAMRESEIAKEEEKIRRKLEEKFKDTQVVKKGSESAADAGQERKRSRWDEVEEPMKKSKWDDATPKEPTKKRWDETPQVAGKSRWDETPVIAPAVDTPAFTKDMMTPLQGQLQHPMTPDQFAALKYQHEMDFRNRQLTDEELDAMLPEKGYIIVEAPSSYVPIRTPARKLIATPTPMDQGFMAEPAEGPQMFDVMPALPGVGELAFFKPEDQQYFAAIIQSVDEEKLTFEELRDRKLLTLLLRIKNGTPPVRKLAMKQITERARDFGAGPLFHHLLPLLMSPSLEDQERHLLVKVIDRILFKLDDLVRPYVHKILVVIEPLLIDEDYYARIEGREIISNLAKAAGLPTMIATMRPDIDHIDEYVRNTTARAFSVVASALGVNALLPFLRAVCKSKKSWQARHTGIKIIQQIAILLGCGILPHLKGLVESIGHGLEDEQQKVRTITALALAALAEAAFPYGIESFESVLKPLWNGIKRHRGKGLAAFLKAIGFVIPLMDSEYANYYTKQVLVILQREFQSPDEEMKKIVLKVLKQCCGTNGAGVDSLKSILDDFFKYFWIRRMAMDRRNYKQLVETTIELDLKVGGLIERIVDNLKDENEAFRKMTIETIQKIVTKDCNLPVLMDGLLYAFQEQSSDDHVVLNGFGTVLDMLGEACHPFVPQITSTVLWRLNNKNARIRQQAADLIVKVTPVMGLCGETKLLNHLAAVLNEYLGEEFPEVLGSIVYALLAILKVVGAEKMTPSIKDLLPRLTPVLKNRHEKVQESTVKLVGLIAKEGAEYVSSREWMRICFELLELLRAQRKSIRRAAIHTFGWIAKAIGPQDVLATLLNNLKVQERQNRVCTTIAIAIVAETCAPFTVLPALMNEYRVPELNVQNGVLKSMAFMFEYIGEMGKDYVYAVTSLLEDALIDRDLVHRQIACQAVKNIALGVAGLGCEDALMHYLNYVVPNIFESSPHVITNVIEALEGLRYGLGAGVIMMYLLAGLFHPARKVREAYWKVYNTIYISGSDALVPYWPRIEDEKERCYERWDLDYFL